MKTDIEKNMEELNKQMNSKEFRESMQKMKDINMDKIKEEMNKAKIELEKNREELKKEFQKMKEELEENNAAMTNYNFGFEKSGIYLDLINYPEEN